MSNSIQFQQMQQRKKQKITTAVFTIALIGLLLGGYVFVSNTWEISIKSTEKEALEFASATEAVIQKSLLINLDANSSDLDKAEYREIKSSLINLAYQKNEIRLAYIYIRKNSNIYFLVDSEPLDSKEYSPPGQEYSEASDEYFLPFEKQETILTKPTSDRWGEWISILVPMKNIETGEIVGVFGVKYSAENWNDHAILRSFQAGFVVLCILLIFASIHFAFSQNLKLRREKKKLIDSEANLKVSETLFKTIFNQAPIGIAIGFNDKYTSTSKNLPSMNFMFEEITGRNKEDWEKVKRIDVTQPNYFQMDVEHFDKCMSGEISSYDIERQYIKPDGSEVWLHIIIAPLFVNNNSDYNHLCITEDITMRKSMEKALYESERSKAVLLNNLPGMAYRCNYDKMWTMQFVSEGCFALTGYKAETLLYNKEKAFNDLIHPQYQEYLWNKWAQILKNRSQLKEEYELITASGEIKWVFEQGQGVYDENGNILSLEGLIIDISDLKKQEMKLKYINDHDVLTGLYNRRYFQEVITNDLESDNEEKRAVILVNLRKFSIINLTFGYTFGEKLIKELANNITSLCTTNCHLFHISFDRFIFYVKGYKEKDELIVLCDSIIEMLNSTLAPKTIGGNIGVVEIDKIKYDVDSIMKNASIAAENVKEDQIWGYNFFDRKMEEIILREADIKNELAQAVLDKENPSLFVVYQPILDFKTNRINGFEALARFKNDKLGSVSPVEFIPIAELTQLIVPLGKKIMYLAFGFLKQLRNKGYNNINMSFNVSAIQLLRDDFLPDLIEIINEIQVDSHSLSIEITESIFSNNYQEINEKLYKIKALGIKIAIDDFGTGYSSLARERELNVNCLKIDKYFIDKLIYLDANEAITGDIISMAHKLGHSVVAEGVEHEKQKQYLIEHNCDLMQGYLFSKPLSEEDAIMLLDKTN